MSTSIVMTEPDNWTDEDILYLAMRGRLPQDFEKSLGKKGRERLAEAVRTGDVSGGIRKKDVYESKPEHRSAERDRDIQGTTPENEPKEPTNDELRTQIVLLSEQLGIDPDVNGKKDELKETVAKLEAQLEEQNGT